jgi:hypothetical protein
VVRRARFRAGAVLGGEIRLAGERDEKEDGVEEEEEADAEVDREECHGEDNVEEVEAAAE